MKSIKKFTSNQLALTIVVAVFAVMGGILLISTHASTPVASLEAESGTVSSVASKVNDNTASGAKAVMFGASTATPPTTGWPDATNTGVPAGTSLIKVPSQATSGPGWSWNAQNETAEIRTAGTVFSGYFVTGNVDIDADNVTIKNSRIENNDYYAVEIRAVQYATITHSTIGGIAGGAYCDNAIRPIYGTEDNFTITYNNIQHCSSGINEPSRGGLIAENYIHDFGQNPGHDDHFNGIQLSGGCHGTLMTIRHNTILNNADQADAVAVGTDECAESNRLVENNLLAGGSYTIYGGGESPESNVQIINNTISRQFFSHGGSYGPVANPPRAGNGNAFTGNHYDDGTPIN